MARVTDRVTNKVTDRSAHVGAESCIATRMALIKSQNFQMKKISKYTAITKTSIAVKAIFAATTAALTVSSINSPMMTRQNTVQNNKASIN